MEPGQIHDRIRPGAQRGRCASGVQFEIDANGILHVLARDIATGKQQVVEMRSAVDVNDSDVQRMVEESVEHAFDDLKARRWVETKVRARETLVLTREGLADCGSELPPEQLDQIRTALERVEAALATEDPTREIGDLDALKSGLSELDQSTVPLADLLMDKAIEARLRQRGAIS